MTLASAEHVEQTEMFIDANPSTIILSRPTVTSDGAGGRVITASTARPAQTMRLVGLSSARGGQAAPRVTVDGVSVVPQFALIALPSADMLAGDQFMHKGRLHEVVFINENPEWRKQGEVFRHG